MHYRLKITVIKNKVEHFNDTKEIHGVTSTSHCSHRVMSGYPKQYYLFFLIHY